MPWSARRPCRYAGCANLSTRGKVYCAEHAAMEHERMRMTSAQRGYDAEWRAARRMFLARNPLCAECRKNGKLKAATCVDHIVPHRGDKRLFWDESNWQPLCNTCHSKKTARGE